jgi:hypothetical protein
VADEAFFTGIFFQPPLPKPKTALDHFKSNDAATYVHMAFTFAYLRFHAESDDERDYIDGILQLPDTEDGRQQLSAAYETSPPQYAAKHQALKGAAMLRRALALSVDRGTQQQVQQDGNAKLWTAQTTPLWKYDGRARVLNVLTRLGLFRVVRRLDPDLRTEIGKLAVTHIYKPPRETEEEGVVVINDNSSLQFTRALAAIDARCAFDSSRDLLYTGSPICKINDTFAVVGTTYTNTMPFPAPSGDNKDDAAETFFVGVLEALAHGRSDAPDAGNAGPAASDYTIEFSETALGSGYGRLEIESNTDDTRVLITPMPSEDEIIAELRSGFVREIEFTTEKNLLLLKTRIVPPSPSNAPGLKYGYAQTVLQYVCAPDEDEDILFGLPCTGRQLQKIMKHVHPVLQTVVPPPRPPKKTRIEIQALTEEERKALEPGGTENANFLTMLDLLSGCTLRFATDKNALIQDLSGCTENLFSDAFDCSDPDTVSLVGSVKNPESGRKRELTTDDLKEITKRTDVRSLTVNLDAYRLVYFKPCGSTLKENVADKKEDKDKIDEESEIADNKSDDEWNFESEESTDDELDSDGEKITDDEWSSGAPNPREPDKGGKVIFEPDYEQADSDGEIANDEEKEVEHLRKTTRGRDTELQARKGPLAEGPLRRPRFRKRKRPTTSTRQPPPKKQVPVGEFSDDTIWMAKPADGKAGHVGVVERDGNYFIIYAFTHWEHNRTITWSEASTESLMWLQAIRFVSAPNANKPRLFPAAPSLAPRPKFADQLLRDCQLKLEMVNDKAVVCVPKKWPIRTEVVFHFTPFRSTETLQYLKRLQEDPTQTKRLGRILNKLNGRPVVINDAEIQAANDELAELFCNQDPDAFSDFVFRAIGEYTLDVGTLPVVSKYEISHKQPDADYNEWFWLCRSNGKDTPLTAIANEFATTPKNQLHLGSTYRKNPLDYVGAAIQLLWYSQFFEAQQRKLVDSLVDWKDSSFPKEIRVQIEMFYPGGLKSNTEFTGLRDWFQMTATEMFTTAGRAEFANASSELKEKMLYHPADVFAGLANNTPCSRVPPEEWTGRKLDWKKDGAGRGIYATQYEKKAQTTSEMMVYLNPEYKNNFIVFLGEKGMKTDRKGQTYFTIKGKRVNVKIKGKTYTGAQAVAQVPLATDAEGDKRPLEGFAGQSDPKRARAEDKAGPAEASETEEDDANLNKALEDDYAQAAKKLGTLGKLPEVKRIRLTFDTSSLTRNNQDAFEDFFNDLLVDINEHRAGDVFFYTNTELAYLKIPECTLWQHTLLHLGQSPRIQIGSETYLNRFAAYTYLSELPIIGTFITRVANRLKFLRDQGTNFADGHALTMGFLTKPDSE